MNKDWMLTCVKGNYITTKLEYNDKVFVAEVGGVYPSFEISRLSLLFRGQGPTNNDIVISNYGTAEPLLVHDVIEQDMLAVCDMHFKAYFNKVVELMPKTIKYFHTIQNMYYDAFERYPQLFIPLLKYKDIEENRSKAVKAALEKRGMTSEPKQPKPIKPIIIDPEKGTGRAIINNEDLFDF